MLVDFLDPCPTCLATGGVRVPCLKCKSGEPEHSHKCPDCVGGRVVSESVIEEMAEELSKVICGDEMCTLDDGCMEDHRTEARAAARVVLEHMEGSE